MALATRCNSCGTVFRVVQDQLRVSEGWVRCGRCSAVFNAALELFDLDNGAPVSMPPTDSSPMPFHASPTTFARPGDAMDRATNDAAAASWRSAPAYAASPGLAPPARTAPDAIERLDDEPAHAYPEPPRQASQPQHFEEAVDIDADDGQRSEAPLGDAPRRPADPEFDEFPPATALLDPIADDAAPAAILDFGGAEPGLGGASIQVDADETMLPPSFVRAAERAAFWRQPRVRAGLLASIALLALLLVAQAGVAWRDPLAAHVPALRPALAALCSVAGCEVSPLRRIERLSVDSSGLSRLEGTPMYRLQLVLRSRADTALLAPALELSLTDSQGRLVLRRVLQGAELGLSRPVIDAGQELPLQLQFAVGEQRVTGYTVELFYP